jgi:hypothetical protein
MHTIYIVFTHIKKVEIESFRPGSGSDQKGPDLTESGSATLPLAGFPNLVKLSL